MSTSSASNNSKREYTPIPEAEQRNKLQRINFESFFKPVDQRDYRDLLAPYKDKKFRECCAEQKKLVACIMNEEANKWPEDYTPDELELADEWCENWAPNRQFKTSPTLPVAHAADTTPRNGEEVRAGKNETADGIDWEDFWSRGDTVAKIDAFVEDYYTAQKIQRAAVYQTKRRVRNAIKEIALREEVDQATAKRRFHARRRREAIDYKKFGTDGTKIKKIKDQEQRELQVIADTLMEDAPEEEESQTPEVVYVKIDTTCNECGQTFTTTAEEGFISHVGDFCNACLKEMKAGFYE